MAQSLAFITYNLAGYVWTPIQTVSLHKLHIWHLYLLHIIVLLLVQKLGSGKEVSGHCGKWAVLGDCLWKFCANFIVGGTSWREWLCGSILHLNISDICTSGLRGELHLDISVQDISCWDSTTSRLFYIYLVVRIMEVISFYSINRLFLHSISLSSIGIVVLIIVRPEEQI